MDPWHFGTDPDPSINTTDIRSGSCIFCQRLTRCQQKISFHRYKVKKRSQNSRNQGYFNSFACWWNGGSGSGMLKDVRIGSTTMTLSSVLNIFRDLITFIFSYCLGFLSILGFTALPSIHSPYFCFRYGPVIVINRTPPFFLFIL